MYKRFSIIAASALSACALLGGPVSSAGALVQAPDPGTPNIEMSGYFDDGGAGCAFKVAYGNIWTAAFAKIKLLNYNCKGASVSSYYTNSAGACCDSAFAEVSTIGNWVSPSTTAYTTGVLASFAIANTSGYTMCLAYAGINNVRYWMYTVQTYYDYCQ